MSCTVYNDRSIPYSSPEIPAAACLGLPHNATPSASLAMSEFPNLSMKDTPDAVQVY